MAERTPLKSQSKEPEDGQPFHLKYRPRTLEEVVGQPDVVKSLRSLHRDPSRPHAFLLTGPSGCGKTTIARILATGFQCQPNNVIEIDAASNSGIDAMKEVMSTLRYQGFGETPNRAIIIDECHALSKPAWQSWLKTVEEPPAHVYIFFCTTEIGKVPETIVTRCHAYNLKPVKFDPLMDLLEMVADREDLKTPGRILELVARSCSGSPRQALVMLSMVRDCEDEEEAAVLLEAPIESKEVIDLCRLMLRGDLNWSKLTATLKAMPEMSPESVRIVITNYLASCAMGARSEKEAARIVDMLFAFSKPCNPSDKWAPIMIAFGDLLFRN